ncbi:MAG: hypothetical protein HYS13_24585 [Planctomycetia bacterium]|nr:hypothetical protein [Planctomycetia bacterium]
MILTRWLAAVVTLAALTASSLAADQQPTPATGEPEELPAVQPRQMYGAIPPLYYNYYYPAENQGQIPARMYLAPLPVPEYVGYTYITYAPVASHHLMHTHARYWVRNYSQGGSSITRATYDYYDPRPFVIRRFHEVHGWLNTR